MPLRLLLVALWKLEGLRARRRRAFAAPHPYDHEGLSQASALLGVDLPEAVTTELANTHQVPVLNVTTSSRGAPIWSPGFIEVADRKSATGFLIERVLPNEPSATVIYQGALATQSYYARNRKLLLDRGLDAALRCIARPKGSALHNQVPTDAGCAAPVSLLRLASYLANQSLRLLRRHRWSSADRPPFTVGFHSGSLETLDASSATRVPSPPDAYLADPFVLEALDGSPALLVEEFRIRENRARISCIKLDEPNRMLPVSIIEEPFHLSFPFPVNEGNRLYICPEASASHKVTLYGQNGDVWKPVSVLLDGVDAVDPCLVKHQGLWYLMVTADSTGNGELLSQLHIFMSDRLEASAWMPHPLNPVVESPTGGRNGGLVRRGSDLLRLGQFHRFREYGSGLNLYQIQELSPTRYSERLLTDLDPWARRLPRRAHHLSANSRYVAFDLSTQS